MFAREPAVGAASPDGRTTCSPISAAAEAGLKYGAIGYLNTDWGDHGHLQYLPMSFAGLAKGAA